MLLICVGVFDPQGRREMRVRRDSEDPQDWWDPKEMEASKVRRVLYFYWLLSFRFCS